MRRVYRYRQDVPDLHVVVHIKGTRYDARTVEFFAYDTAADRVAVESDQHVKERCAVEDNDLLITVNGAQDLFGEIKGVMAALLVRKPRVRLQVLERDPALRCKRRIFAEEYVRLRSEKRSE